MTSEACIQEIEKQFDIIDSVISNFSIELDSKDSDSNSTNQNEIPKELFGHFKSVSDDSTT